MIAKCQALVRKISAYYELFISSHWVIVTTKFIKKWVYLYLHYTLRANIYVMHLAYRGYTKFVFYFICIYGIVGVFGGEPSTGQVLSILFQLYIIGLAFWFFVICYFSASRKIFYNIVGEEFVKKYASNSQPFGRMVLTFSVPLTGIMIYDHIDYNARATEAQAKHERLMNVFDRAGEGKAGDIIREKVAKAVVNNEQNPIETTPFPISKSIERSYIATGFTTAVSNFSQALTGRGKE